MPVFSRYHSDSHSEHAEITLLHDTVKHMAWLVAVICVFSLCVCVCVCVCVCDKRKDTKFMMCTWSKLKLEILRN